MIRSQLISFAVLVFALALAAIGGGIVWGT
jgi:hypothetical protein